MKVLVGNLSGAKTTSARGWIIAGLQQDGRFEVVGGDEGAGIKTGASSSAIAEAALGLEADAVILGRSSFGNKGWNAELEIYDGKDGSLIEKVPVPGGSFEKYEAALTAGEAYFAVVEKAEGFPPPAAEPAPEPEPEIDLEEEVAVEATVVDKGDFQPSPLDVMVGMRLYSRSFRYTDSLAQLSPGTFEPLPDYNLEAGPLPFIQAHWYPAAHFSTGILAHLGLTLGYERGIATTVKYIRPSEADPAVTEEVIFNQTHQLWYVGGRARIPVAMFTFGVGVNYGNHAFALKESGDGSPTGLFPNVSYNQIEAGADAEVKMGSVLLGAYGSYLHLLGAGELVQVEWFPGSTGRGVHFGGHVGWAALPALDLLAGVDARAYGFNFNPVDTSQPADRPVNRVAGGATDRYLSAWFGLRFKIPEKGSASSSAEGDGGGEASGGFDDFD